MARSDAGPRPSRTLRLLPRLSRADLSRTDPHDMRDGEKGPPGYPKRATLAVPREFPPCPPPGLRIFALTSGHWTATSEIPATGRQTVSAFILFNEYFK